MKYKKGDIVLIKTWQEMIQEFDENKEAYSINLPIDIWNKSLDDILPNNRIVILLRKSGSDTKGWRVNTGCGVIYSSMIKGYANEYYLQQIKEEIDGKKDII